MPTTPRPLTNDYRDCRLIKLDLAQPNSPLVVIQEGYARHDPTCRMRMFFLQRDGQWIDEIARSTRPDSELGDVIFDSSADAIRVLSGLLGQPFIRELPVTEADTQAYMARVKSGSAEDLFRQALSRYRATTGPR